MNRRTASAGFLFLFLGLAVATSCAADEVPKITFISTWGQEGDKPGEFNFPISIAINAADEVFVTDHYNDRVQKFDASGRLLAVYPVLPHPGGITVDGRDLYLTHFPAARASAVKTPDRVTVYDGQGHYLREWGSTGKGDGQFDFPNGIAISKAGEVHVADSTNRRVQVFDKAGKFLRKWGEYGMAPGQFGGNSNPKSRVGGPQFIAMDRAGDVFTTEASVGRIQKFTSEGKPLLAWGKLEDKPGAFGRAFAVIGKLAGPICLVFDQQQRLWVSAAGGRVQCFTAEGQYLAGIGEKQGTAPGEFHAPHGIAINSRNELYVVDSFNHRIQRFALAR